MSDAIEYDIDVAGVRGTLRVVQGQLEDISVADIRAAANAVENSLGASKTLSAFTRYADEVLIGDSEATLTRIRNAVGGVDAAMAEYVSADNTMTDQARRAVVGLPMRAPVQHARPGRLVAQ